MGMIKHLHIKCKMVPGPSEYIGPFTLIKQQIYNANLKGKFSGIEGALASTLNHDFNWKQLSKMILCIFLLMFSKFIWVT